MDILASRIESIKSMIEEERSYDIDETCGLVKSKILDSLESWLRKGHDRVVVYPLSEFGSLFCTNNYPTHKERKDGNGEVETNIRNFLIEEVHDQASVFVYDDKIGEKPILVVLHL